MQESARIGKPLQKIINVPNSFIETKGMAGYAIGQCLSFYILLIEETHKKPSGGITCSMRG